MKGKKCFGILLYSRQRLFLVSADSWLLNHSNELYERKKYVSAYICIAVGGASLYLLYLGC